MWVGVAQHLCLCLPEENSSGPPNVTPTNTHLCNTPCDTSYFMAHTNMTKCDILGSHNDDVKDSDIPWCCYVAGLTGPDFLKECSSIFRGTESYNDTGF